MSEADINIDSRSAKLWARAPPGTENMKSPQPRKTYVISKEGKKR